MAAITITPRRIGSDANGNWGRAGDVKLGMQQLMVSAVHK